MWSTRPRPRQPGPTSVDQGVTREQDPPDDGCDDGHRRTAADRMRQRQPRCRGQGRRRGDLDAPRRRGDVQLLHGGGRAVRVRGADGLRAPVRRPAADAALAGLADRRRLRRGAGRDLPQRRRPAAGHREHHARGGPGRLRRADLDVGATPRTSSTRSAGSSWRTRASRDPTAEQITQAGIDVFNQWPDAHDLEIDPRYGLRSVDGVLSPVDTNTSVAVGETAKAGMSTEPDPAFAETLPVNHRCG